MVEFVQDGYLSLFVVTGVIQVDFRVLTKQQPSYQLPSLLRLLHQIFSVSMPRPFLLGFPHGHARFPSIILTEFLPKQNQLPPSVHVFPTLRQCVTPLDTQGCFIGASNFICGKQRLGWLFSRRRVPQSSPC